MKKIITGIFLLLSFTAAAKDENKHMSKHEQYEQIENLSPEQKEKLLAIRREYFSELKVVQLRFRELRKEANHCMMNNDEIRYEKIHDEMNELKLQREKLKISYRKKINAILEK